MASSTREESGDFMVLQSSTDMASHHWDHEEQLINERSEVILKLKGMCGEESSGLSPLRVVVVGKHGAGKSSFINGISAALSEERWREYAYTGSLGRGTPVTITNERHVKCNNGQRECFENTLLPTLIDVAGLSDDADELMEELLRLLFYGHIQGGEPLMRVYEEIQRIPILKIRKQYKASYADMQVDRVIFVASAEDPLPDRLMSCVHRAARPAHHKNERRAVPIFGVLTKMDKVERDGESFLRVKANFMRQLGLDSSRFLQCSNYCDDIDPNCLRTQKLRPDLDLPILRFMLELCDRARKVTCGGEVLPGSTNTAEEENDENAEKIAGQGLKAVIRQEWKQLASTHKEVFLTVIATLIIMIIRFVLPSHDGQLEDHVKRACDAGAIKSTQFTQLLCQGSSAWGSFLGRLGDIILCFVLFVVFFATQRFSRL